MSKEVDPTLQRILAALQEQCKQSADPDSKRGWMLPPDWDGDPTDLESLGDAFSRDDANQAYAEALQNDGTMADAMASQTAAAYLGMMERAFRMRHLSQSRALAHATAVRKAHGMDEGVHVGVTLQHIQNMTSAG